MVEKPRQGENKHRTPSTMSDAVAGHLRSLHGAFLDRYESKGEKAITADKFIEYVSKQSHGKNLLRTVNSREVKIFFDTIQQQGTSLHTIKHHTDYFRSSNASEEDQLDQAYNRIKKNLDAFPGKRDTFIKHHKLTFSSNNSRLHLTSGAKKRTNIRHLGDLHAAWSGFLAKEKINHDNLNQLLDHISSTHDEHIMMHAIYNKTRTKLDPKVRKSFDQTIVSLDAYSTIQTVDDLMYTIDQWLSYHPDQEDIVNNVIIRNNDIYQAYQQLGGKGSVQGDFSTWDKSLQTMVDRNSSLAATSTYEGSREYIQDNITKAQQMMHVLSPQVGSLVQQYPMDDTTLRTAYPAYDQRIDKLSHDVTNTAQHKDTPGDEGLRARATHQKLHREKELLTRQARVASIRLQDERLADLLTQGPNLDWDFSKLSKEDQCYLGWACARDTIENRDEDGNLHRLDRDRYSAFVRDMFDPQPKEIIIPTDQGESMTIPVKDKGFLAGGVHPSQFETRKIDEYKHLGFGVDIEVTDDNESAIKKTLPGLFQEIAGQSIAPSYRVQLTDQTTGEAREGYLMNVGYTGDEVEINDKNTRPPMKDQWMLFDYPPTKPGRTYPEPQVIRHGTNLGDTKEVEKTFSLTPLDKTLTLTGDSLDKIALARAIGDRLQHPQKPEQALDDSWEDMIDAINTPEPDTFTDSYTREQQQTDHDIDTVEHMHEGFLGYLKSMVKGPDRMIENINTLDDLVGHNLRVQHGESQIPPGDKELPYRIRLEIADINEAGHTISFVMHGTDNTIKDHEGKTYTLPLESSTLRHLEQNTNDSSLYMLPSYADSDDLTEYLQSMKQASILDKEESALFGGLTLTKNGFKRNSGGDVLYFADKKTDIDPHDDNKTIDIPLSYRIKRIGTNTFDVSNPDISYRKTMDMPTLLIFISSRRLQAMTKDEKERFVDKTLNPNKYTHNAKDGSTDGSPYLGKTVGLIHIWSFLKDSHQKVKDNIDNYNKKQVEDMSDLVLGHYGLYGKMGKLMSFAPSIKDAFDNMHGEYMQERDKKTFDLINGYKDFLAGNANADEVVKTHIIGLLDDAKRGKVPTDRRGKLFAAGAYLYMLEELGGPYAGDASLAPYRGSGLWIKILYGEDHYRRCRERIEEATLAAQRDPSNPDVLEKLADVEAEYSHQALDNPGLKTFYSKKFQDSVTVAKRKGNDPERINKTAKNFGSQKNFGLNEVLFGLNLKKGDIGKTIGHLKAMAMSAQGSGQINKVRLYMLELMLSGIILYQTNDVTKSTFSSIASKMGFIPGTWVKDANQQHKIHTLLDYVTGGNFSKKTTYTDTMFQRTDYGSNLKSFHSNYQGRINADGKMVCDFLTLQDVDKKPKENLLAIIGSGVGTPGPNGGTTTHEHLELLHDIKDGMMNTGTVNADRDLQNRFLFTAPLAIPNSVISSQLAPERHSGRLNSGNEKEAAMKEVFWKSMANNIPTTHILGSEKFFIEKFVSLIPGVTDHKFMHQALLSAQYHIHKGQPNIAKALLRDTMRVLPVTNNMNSLDRSVEDTLKKYVEFFSTNLGEIEDTDLMRSLHMDAGLDIGSSRLAKPFQPPFNPSQSKNKTNVNTLNHSIHSLYKTLENRGQPWNYFGSSQNTTATKEDDTHTIKKLRPDLTPIENTSEYNKVINLDDMDTRQASQNTNTPNESDDDHRYKQHRTG